MSDPAMILAVAVAVSILIVSVGFVISLTRPGYPAKERERPVVKREEDAEALLMRRLSEVVGKKYSANRTDRRS